MKKMMFAKAAVFLLFFAGLMAGVSAQITISERVRSVPLGFRRREVKYEG
jgi:hypothetical protein